MVTLKGYTAYTCGWCLKHFLAPFGHTEVSCTVRHPANDCCHYGEQKVTWSLPSENEDE